MEVAGDLIERAAGRFTRLIADKGYATKAVRAAIAAHGGEAHGKVVKKVTTPTQIKGHKVAASKDNPEFIVETNEGKRAAHKPGGLTRE